jgi:hypothetical protein
MTRSRLKAAAACGIAGPALFAGVLAALSLGEQGFMTTLGWNPLTAPTHDWPSGLALGPWGLVMSAAFVACGLGLGFFARALRAALPGAEGRAASLLLALAGAAMVCLVFPTDPTDAGGPSTLHGRIHDASFVVLGAALVSAMAVFGFAFLRRGWRAHAVLSWVTVGLIVPSFTAKGLVFYFFLAAVLAWCEAAAVRVLRMARHWTERTDGL